MDGTTKGILADEAGAKAVQERVERRRAEEEATGKKKRGRKPKVVEPLPTEEAKANTTDPDSRIMKTRQGYVQGYNAQAVVREEQIIVAVGVTQEANDAQQLEPMLQTMAHTLEAAGIEDRPKAGLADAGYWSEANIRACPWPEMPELLIATTKDWKQRKMLREKGCPRGRIPKGLSSRDRMERKLLTKRGRALYKKRGVLVEPPPPLFSYRKPLATSQLSLWIPSGRSTNSTRQQFQEAPPPKEVQAQTIERRRQHNRALREPTRPPSDP